VTDAYFIAGTDTDVGKTLVTAALLCALRAAGRTSAAVKPVAAGARLTAQGWRNEDGEILQRCQSAGLSYDQVNPVVLRDPVSPHIAARNDGRRITVAQLEQHCRAVMRQPLDVVLIEGAGGWRVPVNEREYLSALPRRLDIPVILVVGLKLGCLNHALLTAEAIARDGLTLVGWVANQVDPHMAAVQSNLDTLRARLPGTCLGAIPWLPAAAPDAAARYLQPLPKNN